LSDANPGLATFRIWTTQAGGRADEEREGAYTGERKRPKEMTLPMMPTMLRAASAETIFASSEGGGVGNGEKNGYDLGRSRRREGELI
jgi:hypothetical protein